MTVHDIRARRHLLLLFVATLAACGPSMRSAGEAVPGVAAAPRPGLSVYDADLELDSAQQTLRVRWGVAYVADSSSAREVAYLLNAGLTIRDVRGPAVRSFEVMPPDAEGGNARVAVALDPPAAPGSTVNLEVLYEGRPRFGEGYNTISPDWVELTLDGFWHPVAATFDQQLTGVLRVNLPEGWEIVSSGTSTFVNGMHVLRSEMPQVDVAFVAAPSFEEQRGQYFTAFHRGASPATVTAVLESMDACTRYLNARYGAADSLHSGRVVLTDRAEVGYARKNFVVLSRVDPDAAIPLSRFACHELAHFWGMSVDFMSPHHWMSEAFAELVSARFIRDRFGQEEYDRIIQQWDEVGRAHGPVWTPESTRRPNAFVMYRRAPHLLHRLELQIGRERFDRFLERYMVHGARTTPELLQHLRAVTGEDAESWFRAELARPPAAPR